MDFDTNCLLFSPERLETGDKSRRFLFFCSTYLQILPLSPSNIETHFFKDSVKVDGGLREYNMIWRSVGSSKVNNAGDAQNFAHSPSLTLIKRFFFQTFFFLEIVVTKQKRFLNYSEQKDQALPPQLLTFKLDSP